MYKYIRKISIPKFTKYLKNLTYGHKLSFCMTQKTFGVQCTCIVCLNLNIGFHCIISQPSTFKLQKCRKKFFFFKFYTNVSLYIPPNFFILINRFCSHESVPLNCIYFCSVSSCSALTSLLGSHFLLDQVSSST